MGKEKRVFGRERKLFCKRKLFDKSFYKDSVSVRMLSDVCIVRDLSDAFKFFQHQQRTVKEGGVRMGTGTAGGTCLFSSGFPMETSGGMRAAFACPLPFLFVLGKEKRKEGKAYLALHSLFAVMHCFHFPGGFISGQRPGQNPQCGKAAQSA